MTSPVAVGDLIADKYRVERVLGQGGMGVVVAAEHIHLGQRVAVKFLLPSVGESSQIMARFEREARAAVALHSDHVTRVLDVGRLPSGSPYMVMEMLEGTDLAQELRKRKRIPAREAAAHIAQACDALAEAHGLGIIHRDIKPANLFLAQRPKREPTIKVLDFGISKTNTLAEGVIDITHTTELIGSPLYMSPEQLRAPKTVDGRSDVWSLGATLYELVSGKPPFDGETLAELGANILRSPPADLRSQSPGVEIPDALVDVIARCLEKRPEDRYASAEDLAVALAPIARMAPSLVAPAQNPMATTSPAPAHAPGSAPPPRSGGMTLPLLPGPTAPPPPIVESGQALPSSPEVDSRAVSEAAVSYPPRSAASRPSRRVAFGIAAAAVAACAGIGVFAVKELSHRTTPVSVPSVPSPPPASVSAAGPDVTPVSPSSGVSASAAAASASPSASAPSASAPSSAIIEAARAPHVVSSGQASRVPVPAASAMTTVTTRAVGSGAAAPPPSSAAPPPSAAIAPPTRSSAAPPPSVAPAPPDPLKPTIQ